jgi:hypothetical protein
MPIRERDGVVLAMLKNNAVAFKLVRTLSTTFQNYFLTENNQIVVPSSSKQDGREICEENRSSFSLTLRFKVI